MEFDWDEHKNTENMEKHKLSFYLAQKAFFDKKRIIIADTAHSQTEKRYLCIGNTGEGIATVRFVIRGRKIRIFGAGYWRKGKKEYEKQD